MAPKRGRAQGIRSESGASASTPASTLALPPGMATPRTLTSPGSAPKIPTASLASVYKESTERPLNWVVRRWMHRQAEPADLATDTCYKFESKELLQMAKEIMSDSKFVRIPETMLRSLRHAISLRKLSGKEHRSGKAKGDTKANNAQAEFIKTLEEIHHVLVADQHIGNPQEDGLKSSNDDIKSMREFVASTEPSEVPLEVTDEPDPAGMARWCLLRQLLELARWGDELWRHFQADGIYFYCLCLAINGTLCGISEVFQAYKEEYPDTRSRAAFWKVLGFDCDIPNGKTFIFGRIADWYDVSRLTWAPAVERLIQFAEYRRTMSSTSQNDEKPTRTAHDLVFAVESNSLAINPGKANIKLLAELMAVEPFQSLNDCYKPQFSIDRMASAMRSVGKGGSSDFDSSIA